MAEDISLSKLLQAKKGFKGKVLRACYIVGEARFEKNSACMWLQSEDGRHRVRMQVDGFVCSDKEAVFWFPEGCKLDIVDPCVLGGVLRVPDASSIVYTGAKQESEDPDAIRRTGNMAFSEGNFVKAAMLYTESIKAQVSSPGSPAEGLVSAYSNRSQAFFNLGWFDSALEDADTALELCPDHLKSLMRKSKALCGLSLYVEALQCVSHVQGGIEFVQAASRYRKLVEQSESGILDLSEFLRSRGGSVPEFADYVGRVDGRGRGMFATKNFEAGELVMVVNALATGSNDDELGAALVRASLSSPKARQQLECLINRNIVPTMDVFKANNRIVAGDDKVPVKLSNAKIQELVATHSFGYHYPQFDDKAEHAESVWLWSLPALINHACAANVCLEIVGRAAFIRAGRPIKAGDEITISYVDPLSKTPFARNARIRDCWNFSCNCPRCRFELEFERKSRSSSKKSNTDVTKSEALDIISRSKQQESSNLLSQEQRGWILASYTPPDIKAYDLEFLRAAYVTAPGYVSTTNALVCFGIKDGFFRTQPETRQLWREQVLSQITRQGGFSFWWGGQVAKISQFGGGYSIKGFGICHFTP